MATHAEFLLRLRFESDLLKLSTDASRFADYQSKQKSTKRRSALAQVLRMKAENRKGSNLVIDFMNRSARFKSNQYCEEHVCIMQAW